MSVLDDTYKINYPEGYWLQQVFCSMGDGKQMYYLCHESKPSLFLLCQILDDPEIGEYAVIHDCSPEITYRERGH